MSEFEITPPEQPARKLTTEERRIERIRKLKNRMQRETNLLATQTRRTRNSQLISWGIMVEAAFRKGTAEKRQESVFFVMTEFLQWRISPGFSFCRISWSVTPNT